MKTTASYLRITALLVIAIILMELTIDSGDNWVIVEYPVTWAILAIILLFAIAIEVSVASLKSVLYKSLDPEAQERYNVSEKARKDNQFVWLKNTYAKLLSNKPIEQEHEIILDHNYDGIRELDNDLPSWWLYGFYISIIFAGIYLARYHVFNGNSQTQEFEIEMAEAKAAVEEYKRTAPDLIDANSVELLTEASDLNAGKQIFEQKCAACHKADGGGGIGPNLTDEYWILGGGISNVFHTVSEGGRAGKGMVAWKTELKPTQIAQVSSYVLSLQGTTPAEPKEAQGDLWTETDVEVEATE